MESQDEAARQERGRVGTHDRLLESPVERTAQQGAGTVSPLQATEASQLPLAVAEPIVLAQPQQVAAFTGI